MASRLQQILPRHVSLNQTIFIKERNISHGILLAHELVQYLSHGEHQARAAIKVNLRKALDSIRWSFIYEVLRGMNFPPIWIGWIRQCIETPKYSILINGSPNGFLGATCGLRQGDPLSPLIFVLVMESIQCLLTNILQKDELTHS
ncbi:hypothetical protein QJS10_CPB11g00889 [Acorus calamus]|uniref:Reverse transcriptase domain-containing protein n=1 Tax=Acorus calamus TaxID=4465 RepID=A0AAV9DSS4_ACOCL|nr:hypothetical protein QJS10_CPB11g00889 [Acorus calamus]